MHDASGDAITMLTSRPQDPTGYGRIVRGADGAVEAIVEQKDATEDERAIREVNSGIYAFDARFLREALSEVGTDNAQGEMYLTDVVVIARRRGLAVHADLVDDVWQTEGVNDKVQARPTRRRAQPPHRRAGDARRRDRHRPLDDLARRRRDDRPRHRRAARHADPRRQHDRPRLRHRSRHDADRRRGG